MNILIGLLCVGLGGYVLYEVQPGSIPLVAVFKLLAAICGCAFIATGFLIVADAVLSAQWRWKR